MSTLTTAPSTLRRREIIAALRPVNAVPLL